MAKFKYITVGGVPFRGYTGTLTFTGLRVIGRSQTLEQVKELVKDQYDEIGGLHLVIDAETGKVVEDI